MKAALHCGLAPLMMALLQQPAWGSAEGDVPASLSAVTLATSVAGYEFEIKLDAKGSITQLTSIFNGKRMMVPKEEIPAMKNIDLRQAHVQGWRGVHGTFGPLDAVILVIPFEEEGRKDPEGNPGDDEVRVSNVVRFLFHKGELAGWQAAVSLGEKSGAWAFTYKDKGGPVENNGKEEALANPYWTWNSRKYSTPWSKEH